VVRIYRSGSSDELKPSHTGGELGAVGPGLKESMARRWLSAAKFMAAPVIILVVASLLLPALIRARRPAMELRCMAHLKQVAASFDMYVADNEGYPPPSVWHVALRTYIDDPSNPEGRVEPGSARDPLKCPADPTDYPVSYLYLDRRLLGYSRANLSESVIPLAVDEYFHDHVTLTYYDGHVEKLDKQLWLHLRNRQWRIRRDLEHPESFAYQPQPGSARGPTGPPPTIDRPEMYIWPKF